jgi:hypothetical protein
MDMAEAASNVSNRPAPVTAIGYVSVGLAGFAILTSILCVLLLSLIDGGPETFKAIGTDAAEKISILFLLVKHIRVVCIVDVAVSVFILFTAIQFLKLRSWARTVLVTINWLILVWIVGFIILWNGMFANLTSSPPFSDSGTSVLNWVRIIAVPLSILSSAFAAAPHVAAIYYLRKKTTKALFQPS